VDPEEVADLRSGCRILIYPLGNDVPRSRNGIVCRIKSFIKVNELHSLSNRVREVLSIDNSCQRLSASFLSHRGSGSTLWPVRKIDVVQKGHGFCGQDFVLKLFCQLAALG
jgi:hypothetical protein